MPEREVPVVLSRAAVADVEDIYRTIVARNSVAVADRIYRELRAAIQRIGKYPGIGAKRENIRAGHRIVPVVPG